VYYGPWDTLKAFKGPTNQMLTRLNKDLQCDVIRNALLVNQAADKVKFGLAGRGETDLDFLKPNSDKGFEEFDLLINRHGDGKSLIAVT
jgi:predicted membrane GTPase involved in stress response